MLDLTKQHDQHIDARLKAEPIIWLTTVRADGRPHLVPVWFLWDGSTILIFSQPNRQKCRNIEHSPYVVLALDTADEGEDVVIIEGKASFIDDPAITATMPTYAEKYSQLLKRLDSSPTKMAAEYTQAIRITPTRFRGN